MNNEKKTQRILIGNKSTLPIQLLPVVCTQPKKQRTMSLNKFFCFQTLTNEKLIFPPQKLFLWFLCEPHKTKPNSTQTKSKLVFLRLHLNITPTYFTAQPSQAAAAYLPPLSNKYLMYSLLSSHRTLCFPFPMTMKCSFTTQPCWLPSHHPRPASRL